jgi:exopolysaccharide biosynthesis glycosyltransferase PssF
MALRTSVVINNYNNAPYLRDCLESALGQTHPADEVVVYDDGSTDESLAILHSYGDRIKLVAGLHDPARPSRASQANAVHQGFLRSTGDWIFLLDGDDVFRTDKIELTLAALEGRGNVSLVQSACQLIDEHGRITGHYRDARFHESDIRGAIYRNHDVDFFYPTSAMVVSRAALNRVLPLDMSVCPALACDTRIAMCMPLLGEVVTLDEPLAFWRRHSESYLTSLENSRWFQAKQTYRRVRTFNHVANSFQVPRLSLWKNRRFARQVIGALLPGPIRRRLRNASPVTAAGKAEVGRAEG